MISVQITAPQSKKFFREIFFSLTKFKSIITTVLQLKNDFTKKFKQLESPLQKNSVEQPLQTIKTIFLLTASYFTENSINVEYPRQYNRVE